MYDAPAPVLRGSIRRHLSGSQCGSRAVIPKRIKTFLLFAVVTSAVHLTRVSFDVRNLLMFCWIPYKAFVLHIPIMTPPRLSSARPFVNTCAKIDVWFRRGNIRGNTKSLHPLPDDHTSNTPHPVSLDVQKPPNFRWLPHEDFVLHDPIITPPRPSSAEAFVDTTPRSTWLPRCNTKGGTDSSSPDDHTSSAWHPGLIQCPRSFRLLLAAA